MPEAEAVASWYARVYRPLVEVFHRTGPLAHFPGRTETDLYVWISEPLYYLRELHGPEVGLEGAVEDFVRRFGVQEARRGSPVGGVILVTDQVPLPRGLTPPGNGSRTGTDGQVQTTQGGPPMNRLWIGVVCAAALAVPALAQLSGSWEASLTILPSPVTLERSVLTLSYPVAQGWKITSTSTFGTLGLTEQEFGIAGQFGPLTITGGLNFNPQTPSTVIVTYPPGCSPQTESVVLAAPAYKSAWFLITLNLFGVEFGLKLNHWAYPYTKDPTDPKATERYLWPCCPPQTQTYTLLALIMHTRPVTFTARFSDCGAGISFQDVTLTFSGPSFCCGITHHIEVYFTKLGFQYVTFTLDLPICCGIFLESSIRYTVDSKRFSIKPKWLGGGQVCFEIYGDVLWDDTALTINGLAIYGHRFRCEFTACSYIEFLTALDVDKVEEILKDEDLFQGNEFEYLKLGFCGPGCCGGLYTVDISFYFQPEGSLFGFTRFGARFGAPLLANFTLYLSTGISAIGGPTTFSVGWVFRF